MKASESRKHADQINLVRQDKQRDLVYGEILKAERDGGYQCYISISILPKIKEQLISDGYKVEYGSHRNETTVTIKW